MKLSLATVHSTVYATVVAAGLVLAAAACSSSRPYQAPDVFWPSAGSRHHLGVAHQAWLQHHSRRTGSPTEALEAVLEPLERAADNDPRIALVAGIEGQIELDLAELEAVQGDEAASRAHLARSKAAYQRSVGLTQDWIPGHVGLARLAMIEGRWTDGEDAIVAAARALARADGVAAKEPTLLEQFFGWNSGGDQPADPLSAIPTASERQELLLGQLAESERWTLNLPPGEELGVGEISGLQGGVLLRRMRDRIALARADLELARELEAGVHRRDAYRDYAATITRDILSREGDLVEAYLARAVGYRESGNLDGAISDISYLAGSPLPLLQSNDTLDAQLAELEAERDLRGAERLARTWLEGPRDELPVEAVRRFDAVFGRASIDPETLASATLGYCELMLAVSENEGGAQEPLREARRALRHARTEYPAEGPQRAALDEMRKSLGFGQ